VFTVVLGLCEKNKNAQQRKTTMHQTRHELVLIVSPEESISEELVSYGHMVFLWKNHKNELFSISGIMHKIG
jgi:hypothetical protein